MSRQRTRARNRLLALRILRQSSTRGMCSHTIPLLESLDLAKWLDTQSDRLSEKLDHWDLSPEWGQGLNKWSYYPLLFHPTVVLAMGHLMIDCPSTRTDHNRYKPYSHLNLEPNRGSSPAQVHTCFQEHCNAPRG